MATTQQSGFAPAASPLASTIVQTPDDAIVAGFTSIPSQGDNMPAYHARPKQSDGPLPVVIVVQEIFGGASSAVILFSCLKADAFGLLYFCVAPRRKCLSNWTFVQHNSILCG